MTKVVSKLSAFSCILALSFLIACGGSGSTTPFIPPITNLWVGVEEFEGQEQLNKYEFFSADEGSESGVFNPSDSVIFAFDKNNVQISSLAIQGSFNGRNINFDTLDNNNVIVASYNATYLEETIIQATQKIDPPVASFLVYQLDAGGESFAPEIVGKWVNGDTELDLDVNAGYSNGDEAAFINGTHTLNGESDSVEGHYISSYLVIRIKFPGSPVALNGNFLDEDRFKLEDGRTFTRHSPDARLRSPYYT